MGGSMVQVGPLSRRSKWRHLNISDRNTKISRLRSELLENLLVSRICRGRRAACIALRSAADTAAPLDFLRELRIKTPSKIMQRFFLHFFQAVLSIALILLGTGCGEDPRFSGNTSYVGDG